MTHHRLHLSPVRAALRTSATDQSGYLLSYAYTFDGELEWIIESILCPI